jgi:hypothetical protein
MGTRRRAVLTIAVVVVLEAGLRWSAPALAQQPPRYPVDPNTQRAIGAKQMPADELKRLLDAHTKVLLVEVREPGKFNETIPGATSIPFNELEAHLKSVPKDTSGEARGRTRIQGHDVLPCQPVEGTGLSSGAEEELTSGRCRPSTR